MKLRTYFFFLTIFLCSALGFGQIASPAASVPATQVAASNNLAQPLSQLEQTARQTVSDLGRTRVEKWKTEGSVKDQARDNVDSLEKNLSAALPSLIQQVQSNPASVGAVVKLYRNLNVVYDVLASVAESTGAFGSKDDYQALATDVANLDTVRRNIADQLEQMSSAQDAAYARLQNQVRTQRAAAAAGTPPKTVIVDDNAPVKKTSKKKKKTTSTTTASTPQ